MIIEVQAASVNAFDWKAAEGRFKDSFEYQFPVTIGRDYAGVVAAAGSAVTRVANGDEVFGYFTGQSLHRGSYATHVWTGAASVHGAVDEAVFAQRGLHGVNVGSFPDRGLLEELARLAAAGALRVPITGRYTLENAASALADAKQNHSRGKLVIEVSNWR